MSNILSDERVLWIRQRVCIGLDVSIETFDSHFCDTSDDSSATKLATYLSDKHSAGSSIFFAARKWKEDFEGTV